MFNICYDSALLVFISPQATCRAPVGVRRVHAHCSGQDGVYLDYISPAAHQEPAAGVCTHVTGAAVAKGGGTAD
jgi:hypothetical protein